MATQLIPVGTDAASSADFTVGQNDAVTLALNDAAGTSIPEGARATIQIKDPVGQYYDLADLVSSSTPLEMIKTISVPGTFRVVRAAGSVSFGVFRS